MLSNVEHWLVSAAVVVALLVVLFACICGCRKKVPKNELLGLAGMVKITNPEENLDQNYHHENGSSAINDNNRTSVDTAEAHRRAGASTANRSLPDIPVDPSRARRDTADAVWEASEPHSDAGSALYATVTENKDAAAQLLAAAGELAGAAGAASHDGKGGDYASLRQTDDAFAPYAQLKGEHPYDRLRKSEHPYAQVGGASSRAANEASANGASARPRSSAPAAVGVSEPVAPPRARKAASFHAESEAAESAPGADIPAATAIAGHVSANQELPYMTPPLAGAAASEGQAHFSGDSQDSSKGYTSISVREPLANIKAQSQPRQRRTAADDVYTTVSDDSEEVYADIEDAQGVYTSGSETYAQIQPPPEPTPWRDEAVGAPPPPSVDSLKHVAQAHSRQASSSSAASSVANLGSPKPEKRQANSPLPPPPPAGTPGPGAGPDLYATVDKKPAPAPAPAPGTGLAPERTLDEMYAKVMKRTQRGKESDDAASRRLSTDSRSHSTESEPGVDETAGAAEPPPPDGQSQSSADSEGRGNEARHPYRTLPEAEPLHPAVATAGYPDPGYEFVQRGADADFNEICRSVIDPNYEEVQRSSDPNYEEVHQSSDSNYEEVHQSSDSNYEEVHQSSDSNYEQIHGASDPNYEEVHRSMADPNYEELRPQVSKKSSVSSDRDTSSEPGYASIGYPDSGYEKVRAESFAEPGYEEVRAESLAEPGYEKVRAESFAEPGYEKVRAESLAEPGYEKVRPKSLAEPSFEKVRAKSLAEPSFEKVRARSLAEPSFEKVRAKSLAEPSFEKVRAKSVADPGYEKVRAKSVVEPSYAKINKSRRPKSAVSEEPSYARVQRAGGGSEADPNYASVAVPGAEPDYDGAAAEPPYERLTNSRDSLDDEPPSPRRTEGQRRSSATETDYEEVSVQPPSDGRDDWETGRHKLI